MLCIVFVHELIAYDIKHVQTVLYYTSIFDNFRYFDTQKTNEILL